MDEVEGVLHRLGAAFVAAFPALRVLTLNVPQWTRLPATGWRPESLAAVSLAAVSLGGHAGVTDIILWSTAFGREGTHRTLHGRRDPA